MRFTVILKDPDGRALAGQGIYFDADGVREEIVALTEPEFIRVGETVEIRRWPDADG